MSAVAKVPLPRRPDLIIRPLGNRGQVVVKDPITGSYFNLGEEEAFLLDRLDGRADSGEICDAFEAHFGGPLTESDLDGFLDLAREWGFLDTPDSRGPGGGVEATGSPRPTRPRQSLLSWRRNLFDPDRLFDRIEPHLRFFWTRWFLAFSGACIATAAVLVWSAGAELASPLERGVGWEVLVLGWLALVAVTTLHEFAHGLTCKHHGGEVHEVGVLMILLMPGMYCNVSDSWLLPEKSKRIWVTLAGGYFELFLWSLAVFAWRLTVVGSLANTLAWGIISVSGVRVLFNFSPLMKLDGYYILSDLAEIPNLRRKSWDYWLSHLRWLLWGAARPAREPKGTFLLALGMVSWCFSVVMPSLMVLGLVGMAIPKAGWITIGLCVALGGLILRGVFRGFFAGEMNAMIVKRRRRGAVWFLALGGVPAILALGRMEHRPGGVFKVRPSSRVELHAPVAGFIRSVYLDQGDRVSPGTLVAQLEMPDLETKIAQKRAEVREARAGLQQLEAGVRPEELAEQRRRVERAERWRDLALRDLDQVRVAHRENLEALREKVIQGRADRAYTAGSQRRARALQVRGYLSAEQFLSEQAKAAKSASQFKEAEALVKASEAEGTRAAESEIVRRERELAEARATLALSLAGSRPEALEAARSGVARLEEEASFLEGLKDKLRITGLASGLITTPRLREKVGQHVNEGDLIAEVQAVQTLEAEISVDEQAAALIRPGQAVELKARALAFETFRGRVDRVAPSAVRDEATGESTVVAYCRLEAQSSDLKPEMTGYARVSCGRRAIGEILLEKIVGFLRTEFWL